MAEPRLDPRITKEFVNISSFHNTVITAESGHRKVNEQWPTDLRAFRINYVGKWKGTDDQKISKFRALISFWRKMRGNSRYFRFKDWGDYQDWGKGRVALIGDDYRLVKDYHDDGDDNPYTINIYKPVDGTITLSGGAAGGTIDYETGIVTDISSEGTWTGEYDIWGHFIEENLGNLAMQAGGIHDWNGLSFMEKRMES